MNLYGFSQLINTILFSLLGLSIVRDILSQHNATISAKSEEKQGTEFIIKFM